MLRSIYRSFALAVFVAALLICCGTSFAQDAASTSASASGFRALHLDASKTSGQLKSFQGLNGQPSPVMAGLPNLVAQYKALKIDQVRTHDFMGPTEIDSKFEMSNPFLKWLLPDDAQRAGVVKAGNAAIIFPDPAADPENPASYNFGPTDKVLTAIHDSGAEVYYRIGRSFGANINPPADFDKFASIVAHIARHYNQGWDHGFHYNIRYWEFWNEPELFWSGTPAQFYSLYDKTARALKAVDPALKVGGDAKAMASDDGGYREGFIDYCAAHKLPLDFYSWHSYTDFTADPYDAIRTSRNIRQILDTHGFPHAESILSEWNLSADFTDVEKAELRGPREAAFIGAVLSYAQDAPLDHAQFYRGDAAWMGLFDLQGKYFKPARTFEALGKMEATPNRLAVTGADTLGFAAIAGRSADSKTIQILVSNYAIPASFKPRMMQLPADVIASGVPDFSKMKLLAPRTDIVYKDNAGYNLTIDNLPWAAKKFRVRRYRISATQDLDLVEDKTATGATLNISTALPPESVELIVLDAR
ncbi:MAG TPA: hypothetical protein VGD60_05150 [Candidatus Acidoferrales bacterium]